MSPSPNTRLRLAPALLVVIALLGCSAYRTQEQARNAAATGDWDTAVMKYTELVETDPEDLRWRASLMRAKIEASRLHLKEARALQDAGALRQAVQEYRLAVDLDPTNDLAAVELRRALEELADRQAKDEGDPTIAELQERARQWKSAPPTLNPRSKEPIDLIFPEPVAANEIYNHLGKAFGINVIFDRELQDQRLTIELREVTAQDALEMLMRAAGHFYKVLDPHTILVADDNQQNRQRLEDQVIQTFFLSNADPDEVTTMLRSLIGARTVATNEELNAVVLRDNADTVRVAERIIGSNDKARGEVVIDVELIQLDLTKVRQLGAALSSYSIGTEFIASEEDPLRLSDVSRVGERASWQVSVPSVLYQFLKSEADTEFLARPRLRISDGEDAALHIGDQVPIPVTQFNTASTVGGNIVPITSFQYKDVGISIDLTPRIHHNREITLELGVEVSNLAGTTSGGQGLQQPTISTRKIESTIRLADGETNILAGLIQTNDRTSETGIPGLAEIPLVGRLFSNEDVNRSRTDLVLTLTPHIIRTADITEQDLLPIWVGTEGNISFRGASPRLESQSEGPFDEPARSPEEIRQLIRERLETLSDEQPEQGEQPEADEEAEEPEGPPGQDLATPSAPRGISEDEPEASPEEEEEEPEGQSTEPDAGSESAAQRARLTPPFDPDSGIAPAGLTAAPPEQLAPRRESTRSVPTIPEASAPRTVSEAAVRVALLPQRSLVEPGSTFTVRLWVEADTLISHLPTTLSFDPERLEVLGVEPGTFLGSGGESTVMWHASDDGRLTLGLSRLGRRPGVRGEGVVATISLRALEVGETRIGFRQLEAQDDSLQRIEDVERQPLTVVVGERPGRREPPAPRLRGEV